MERDPAPANTPGLQQKTPETRVAPPEPNVTRAGTAIGKSVVIKGDITAQEDIFLDGMVEGALELPSNRLTVGKNGKVQAKIKAKEVELLGTVHGDIIAIERITIRKAANLVGDLKSATISIEDGAYFKGSIDIVRQVPTKPAIPAAAPIPPSGGNGPKNLNPQMGGSPRPPK